jgi:multicomponent Na+:H+ antiporter subunit C
MTFQLAHYSYWVFIVLLMAGLYVVIAKGNLIKKMIGLNVFQVAVIMFYVSMGKVDGGTAPIVDPRFTVYSNPVPHVLMLTAIVVGVATTAVGLALIVRIHEAYDSIEDDEIRALQDAEERQDASTAGSRA